MNEQNHCLKYNFWPRNMCTESSWCPVTYNKNNASISTAQNKLSSVALTAVQTNMSSFPAKVCKVDVSWQTVPHKRTSNCKVASTKYIPGSSNNKTSTRHSHDRQTVIGQIWKRQPMQALVDDRRQLAHDSMTDRKPVKFTQHQWHVIDICGSYHKWQHVLLHCEL